MTISKPREKAPVWMSGTYPTQKLQFKRAVVREGLSTLTETTIEFLSRKTKVDLEDIVGKRMTVHVDIGNGKDRKFTGTCISVEALGVRDGYDHYTAEVRPWFWMLTRTRNLRIFQDMTVIDIIKQIMGDRGFSDYESKVTGSYAARTYCVQYRETDFDFISRLMEEEGIYYYFDHENTDQANEKLVLCDGLSAHKVVPDNATLTFKPRDPKATKRAQNVTEWAAQEAVTRGKVSLDDYDFETSDTDLLVTNSIKTGKHAFKDFEVYDAPGHFRKVRSIGEGFARVQMEAEAIKHLRWRGASNVRALATGYTFSLEDHPVTPKSDQFLVTEAVHYIQDAEEQKDIEIWHQLQPLNIEFDAENKEDYSCSFAAVPKKAQFRAPRVTPWPRIPGVQTAKVVGPSGEEIYTDKFGRIKVLFHWDRLGKPDQTASCWVRVATPWSGRNWGMFSVPRIGQEVVIQFEDGDPDRPLCTGMVYNDKTMPPYLDPKNPTQTGIMTQSSPGGGGYNELVFEDKKDAEFVRMQSEKDYEQIIKNDAKITIGVDKANPGNLTQVVENDVSETINKGNHTFEIKTGKQDITIEGNMTEEIKTGNHATKVNTGNLSVDVKKGNHTTTVNTGNVSVDVKAGKVTIKAAMEIKLVVGGSSIKIDNSGVTIKGPMIKLKADAMAEVASPLTTVKADGMLTLKGALTMIN